MRVASRGGAAISSEAGDFSSQHATPIPVEIPCKSTHTVVVSIAGFSRESGNVVRAKVADAKEHGTFWSKFANQYFDLTVINDEDYREMVLAAALSCDMLVNLSVAVIPTKKPKERDKVKASLIQSHGPTTSFKQALIAMSNQMKLDLQ